MRSLKEMPAKSKRLRKRKKQKNRKKMTDTIAEIVVPEDHNKKRTKHNYGSH